MFVSTGKNAMMVMRMIFGTTPIPNHTKSSGAMVTLGTVWIAKSSGCSVLDKSLELKIRIASTMPTNVPHTKPTIMAESVFSRLANELGVSANFQRLTTTADGAGRMKTGT